jgi:soluble lytic murein transglycosylase
MKKIYFLIGFFWTNFALSAFIPEVYVKRFMAYTAWNQNLPEQPNTDFLKFIEGDTPLSIKLREKWLYKIASQKDWPTFNKYYKPSSDLNLQCFALLADYYVGKTETALASAKPLWLSGQIQPQSCSLLFDLLLKSNDFDENLITKRIKLALDNRNLSLALYLLKQYKTPRLADVQLLNQVNQNPKKIIFLKLNELHSAFYLYGLKRLVSMDMKQAIQLWNNKLSSKMLSEKQQQDFIAYLALYKAMRNHEDVKDWFSKLKPNYSNEMLTEWQIRAALKQNNWHQVENLINQYQHKEEPIWQYWLARAKEKQGFKDQAQLLYEPISKLRNYYGFLTNRHLHKPFQFQDEAVITNLALLKPYQSLLGIIKTLHLSNQSLQASRILNDFISELPKDHKSALIYWIIKDLHWYGKAVNLSNTEELNNQIGLRFPIAEAESIKQFANFYQISQELIYAIIRQESGFRKEVVSAAGARGLMQIMPSTATSIAKKEKISYKNKDQLFIPTKNINLGAAYLKQLSSRYHHPILIAAAYNAGPQQVNYWIKNHPPEEMDIWIETLPWRETRNYLKNIIAFYVVYQYRLNRKQDLQPFLNPI